MADSHPHETRLFRLVTWLSGPGRRPILDPERPRSPRVVIFTAAMIALALGALTAAVAVAGQAWILLPLGASAFTLVRAPLAERSSPRALIAGHVIAAAVGLAVGWASGRIGPTDPSHTQAAGLARLVIQCGVATLAAGLIMQAARCAHEPAIATSVLAAWGLTASAQVTAGLLGGAILLALGTLVGLRFVAGWPYPLWTADPQVGRRFGALSGLPSAGAGFWEKVEERIQRGA